MHTDGSFGECVNEFPHYSSLPPVAQWLPACRRQGAQSSVLLTQLARGILLKYEYGYHYKNPIRCT